MNTTDLKQEVEALARLGFLTQAAAAQIAAYLETTTATDHSLSELVERFSPSPRKATTKINRKDFIIGRRLQLEANEAEGWAEEWGELMSVDFSSQTAIVLVDQAQGPDDDRLREVDLSQIKWM